MKGHKESMEAFDASVSDEELIRQAKSEVAFAQLISRYKKIAEIKARKLGVGRSEAEIYDLIDEGIIAVFYAVRTYDESKNVRFSTYADTCITNRMLTTIEKQNRIRTTEATESEEAMLNEQATDTSPESILLERERFDEVMKRVSEKLSAMELSVFEVYLQTESYKEISQTLNIPVKSVDNAMQRVRKKLKTELQDRE
ncbi:MAG: sigma-70 family RNA polymerase sigma factor [Ruminococcus sp.]|nr:sigma-70 family RNA polymerase sigma factor [Ruminococcus sp.]